jgi:hypothetical protein
MRSTLRCCKSIKRCALGSDFPLGERRTSKHTLLAGIVNVG